MLCETAQEQLNTLSDGERLENKRAELAVWRHCLHCADCRSYRRQVRRLRQTTSHLPALLPDALRERILSNLSLETSASNAPAFTRTTGKSVNTKEITMRKRLALATCATLAIVVTGTLTAQLLTRKMGAGIGDRSGHIWHITSDYRGEVRLYDPQGQFIGSARNSQPSATPNGTVDLEVSGTHLSLHPSGRQEVRDGKGALLGYAQLIPTSDNQYQQEVERGPHSLLEALRQSEEEESKYGGVSGVSASPLGANGWNKQIGVSWKVRGQVAITARDAAGKVIGKARSGELTMKLRQQLPPDALPPATPRIEITVNGKTHTEQGFGSYPIKSDKGALLMQLDVKPLSDGQSK